MKKAVLILLLSIIVLSNLQADVRCWQVLDFPRYCYIDYVKDGVLHEIWTKNGKVYRHKTTPISRA